MIRQAASRSVLPRALLLAAMLHISASALTAQPHRVRVRLPAHPTVIALDTLAVRSEISAPAREAFTVVAAALEHEFKMELRLRDSTAGVVGNLELVKMRRLGNSAMSRYVSCGSGMTGPNADSYRIFLAVAAFIDSLGPDKTRLGVGVAAAAQDVQGSAKAPVACSSTGALESHVRRVVALRFGNPVR